jgi:anaerobic magnesium-protoporphyrin IX monomethyl ester cyclase
MKILLIQPKFENDYYDIRLPALGLAYVAGALRAAGYQQVRILDATLSDRPFEDIGKAVREFAPDVAGLSVTTPMLNPSLEVAKMIRETNRSIRIIFGGVHPTLFPADVAREEAVDIVVFGEGEETVVELVKALEDGEEPEGIRGIAYKKKDRVVVNDPRPRIENLDSIPFPAYDLLPVERYSGPQISKTPFLSMITSRGCPYRCIFCDAHLVFGRKYKSHSAERTFQEIQHLIRHFGVKEIMFKDSEFTFDLKRVGELCDRILEEKVKITWSCNGRIGRIDLPLLKKMRAAGCRLIHFGVESGDQKILDILKKQIKIPDILYTFAQCRRARIKTVANFMIGNPGESRESIEKTFALARKLHADYANFGFLLPLPGTELYEMATDNQWFLENYNPLDLRNTSCVMNATTLSTSELEGMLKKALKSFYLRPSYIFRRIFTLSTYEWKMNLRWFFKFIGS